MAAKQKGPLFWILIGCGGLTLIGGIVLALVAFFGFRYAQEMKETFENPEARKAKVGEILGTTEFPEGYYAMVGIEFFSIFSLAILTDHEVHFEEGQNTQDDLGEKSFIYFKTLEQEKDLKAFIEGKNNDPKVLREANIHVDIEEVVTQGSYPADGGTYYYLIQKGNVASQYGKAEGIQSLILFDCPNSKRTHFGIWSRNTDETYEVNPDNELQMLKDFVSFFHFCKTS